jgi:hypothetical protein
MDASFKLGLILSAVNNTDYAFSSMKKSLRNVTVENSKLRFDAAKEDLFNINNLVGVGMVKGFLDAGMQLEKTKTAFKVFLGDTEKANEAVARLNKFADLTPFSNDEILKAGKALLPYYDNINDIEKRLRMIGDLSAGFEMPIDEFAKFYGSMKGRDVLMGDELKMLESKNLVKPFADMLGISVGELRKHASEGKIHFSDMEKLFESLTQKGGKFYGMTEAQAETASGKLSTAMGSLKSSLAQSAETIMPVMADITNSIIPTINNFAKLVNENKEVTKSIVGLSLGMYAGNLAFKVFNLGLTSSVLGYAKLINVVNQYQNLQKAQHALKIAAAMGNQIEATKNLAIATQEAGMAAKIFNMITRANPYILAATALVTLGAALYTYSRYTSIASISQRTLNDINEEAISKMSSEKTEMYQLFEEMKKTNAGSQERINLVNKAQAQYPEYLKGMKLESQNANELAASYRNATQAMEDKVKAEVAMSYYKKDLEELNKLQYEKEQKLTQIDSGQNDFAAAMGGGREQLKKNVTERYDRDIAKQDAVTKQTKAIYDKFMQGTNKTNNPPATTEVNVYVGNEKLPAHIVQQQRIKDRTKIN